MIATIEIIEMIKTITMNDSTNNQEIHKRKINEILTANKIKDSHHINKQNNHKKSRIIFKRKDLVLNTDMEMTEIKEDTEIVSIFFILDKQEEVQDDV
jgi:hypothetical protein